MGRLIFTDYNDYPGKAENKSVCGGVNILPTTDYNDYPGRAEIKYSKFVVEKLIFCPQITTAQ